MIDEVVFFIKYFFEFWYYCVNFYGQEIKLFYTMKVKYFIVWLLKKYSVEKVIIFKIFLGEIDFFIYKRSFWGCFLFCLVFSYFFYFVLFGEWYL